MSLTAVADALIETSLAPGVPYVAFNASNGAWILVPDAHRIRAAGLALYHPQTMKGVLAKNLRASGAWRPQMRYLKQETLDELRSSLATSIGVPEVHCAFYFRAPGPFAKTIILVMDAKGREIAYVKLGATSHGAQAVENEAAMLERFSAYEPLKKAVPSVIGRATWRDYPLLILSAGPARSAPRGFDEPHRAFLSHLRAASEHVLPFGASGMRARMQARFDRRGAQLEPLWRERYERAFETVARELDSEALPLGLAHRDFVPWNMRRSDDGSLFVFDWELAADECVPGWDVFHFHLARQAFGNDPSAAVKASQLIDMVDAPFRTKAKPLLLAYLADVGLFCQDRLIEARVSATNPFLEIAGAMMDALKAGT